MALKYMSKTVDFERFTLTFAKLPKKHQFNWHVSVNLQDSKMLFELLVTASRVGVDLMASSWRLSLALASRSYLDPNLGHVENSI